MEENKGYLERITRLAGRNKDLKSRLNDMINRYSEIESQNERYEEMVQKYTLELSQKSKTPKQMAKRMRMVSVLYVSVKGFDRLYTLEDPGPLIDQLDELYLVLDDFSKKRKLVKIKSVGDSTLFAAGLSGQSRTNPIDIILTALEMQQAVNQIVDSNGNNFWKLKMGIHTGPVVATINEGKSIPISLTGDSVNIASRMGEATPDGTVCVSIMTYELIKEFFDCKLIGKMPVKYKGDLGMFEVPGILPDLRELNSYILPNQTFLTRYHHSKFAEIQEELLDYMEHRLPKNLYYHT